MAEAWSKRMAWIVQRYEDGNEAAFIKKARVTRETARLWKGKARPKLDNLARILSEYPTINPEWLVTGEGPRERAGGPPDRAVALDVLEELQRLQSTIAARYISTTSASAGPAVPVSELAQEVRGIAEAQTEQAQTHEQAAAAGGAGRGPSPAPNGGGEGGPALSRHAKKRRSPPASGQGK